MTTPSTDPATDTTPEAVMPDADAALLRGFLTPAEVAQLDAALAAGKAVDAAMLAVDAAGHAGADHPAYDELWRIYTHTIGRHDARWRARVAAAWGRSRA